MKDETKIALINMLAGSTVGFVMIGFDFLLGVLLVVFFVAGMYVGWIGAKDRQNHRQK